MSKNKNAPESNEFIIKGTPTEKGVKISTKRDIDELSSKGYGVTENGTLLLGFHEALYLIDKGILQIETEKGKKADFQTLLGHYEHVDENAWVKYLAYRDLRSRGYVVRDGFGLGVDFRVYERGEYSKDTAKYLIVTLQEGKPIALADLSNVLKQSQSLKKELILAVMNRRGEIVYYSVSQLTFN